MKQGNNMHLLELLESPIFHTTEIVTVIYTNDIEQPSDMLSVKISGLVEDLKKRKTAFKILKTGVCIAKFVKNEETFKETLLIEYNLTGGLPLKSFSQSELKILASLMVLS
jgi:hypothetical protein